MIDSPDQTDALAVLTSDHVAILECFNKFLNSETRSEQLANDVFEALEVHAKMELDVFYPEVETIAPITAEVNAARVEHAEIQRQINAMRQRLADKANIDDQMGELLARVRAHFIEEERTLFPAARVTLGAALWDITPALQACKNEAAGAGGVG